MGREASQADLAKTRANRNVQFYERIAPIYDSLYDNVDAEEAVRQWLLLLKRHAGLPKRGKNPLRRLVDLGCGTGRYLDPWASAGFSVTGVDASKGMISRARKSLKMSAFAAQIRLVNCDLRKTSPALSKGQPFDVAVAHLNFLNLFTPKDIVAVMKSLGSCMTEGARLFTDCASPALIPEPGGDRVVLADGTEVDVTTRPDIAESTVIRSYRFRRSEASEKYWLHSTPALKAAASRAGWRLEAAFDWRPDRPRTPWVPVQKSAEGHRVCVFRRESPK